MNNASLLIDEFLHHHHHQKLKLPGEEHRTYKGQVAKAIADLGGCGGGGGAGYLLASFLQSKNLSKFFQM